ncbi:MAG: hypothetical protein AAF211_08030, partial [Myxococcota bacterium]
MWWIVASSAALGADRVVGGPFATDPDLATAIMNAGNGATIALAPGTWNADVTISFRDLTIESLEPQTAVLETSGTGIRIEGSSSDVFFRNVVIDGRNQHAAMTISSGAFVQLSWVRIEDVLRDGNPDDDGGAIQVSGGADLAIEHTAMVDGMSDDDGGFIAVKDSGSTLDVRASTFTRGTAAQRGGAIFCENASQCQVVESRLDDNRAGTEGGAMWGRQVGDLSVERSLLCGSEADRGGAMYADGPLTLRNTLLDDNEASVAGGAVYVEDPPGGGTTLLRSFHNVYRRNQADEAGAGFITGNAFWLGHGDIWVDNTSTTSDADRQDVLRGEGSAAALIDFNLAFANSGGSFTTFPDDGEDNFVRNLVEGSDPQFAG